MARAPTSCQAGTCQAGVCQPYILTSTPLTGNLFVEQTSNSLYGTSAGYAVTLDKRTGSLLATGTTAIDSLLSQSASSLYAYGPASVPPGLTGDELYVISKADIDSATGIWGGTYYSVFGAGATSSNIYACARDPGGYIQMYKFTSSGTSGSIFSICTGSMASDQNGVAYLVQGTSTPVQLYVTNADDTSKVFAGLPPNMTPNPTSPLANFMVLLDALNVYYYDPCDSVMYRSSRDGTGEAVPLTNVGIPHVPSQMAVDSANLYWTDVVAGTVSRVALDAYAVTPTAVPTPQAALGGIAVDSTAVYWSTSSGVVAMVK